MATFKHISSKNADYGAAEQYLTFEHDEFTMKPTLDENGRLVPRDDYRISSLNCGDEDFAIACMRSNLKYGKNQKREDVKSHHYIISFGLLQTVRLHAEGDVLGLGQAVVSLGELAFQHIRVFLPDGVEGVRLIGDMDGLALFLHIGGLVAEGELDPDGAVKV